MKTIWLSLFLYFNHTPLVKAVDQFGQLTREDQKFYQNDSFEGKNQRERIDSIVIEINKLHQEINTLKNEVALLKKQNSSKNQKVKK